MSRHSRQTHAQTKSPNHGKDIKSPKPKNYKNPKNPHLKPTPEMPKRTTIFDKESGEESSDSIQLRRPPSKASSKNKKLKKAKKAKKTPLDSSSSEEVECLSTWKRSSDQSVGPASNASTSKIFTPVENAKSIMALRRCAEGALTGLESKLKKVVDDSIEDAVATATSEIKREIANECNIAFHNIKLEMQAEIGRLLKEDKKQK